MGNYHNEGALPSPHEVERLLGGKLGRDGSIAFPDPFNPKPNKYPFKFWFRPEQRDGFTIGSAIRGVDQLKVKDRVREMLGQAPFQPRPPLSRANGKERAQRPADSPSAHDHPALPPSSDEALALEFAEQHANTLRYTAATRRWLHFDGCRWREEETRLAWDLARALSRKAAAVPGANSAEKRDVASAKKRASIVSLAAEDRRLAARIDQWDADPWLLNTPAGVIDLKTGQMRAHRPQDYITKITAVAPSSDACPRWRQFLDEVAAGDQELVGYLQRVAGYALTGSTREHALFFLHGSGGNGKSKLVETLAGVLGDYHQEAPIATFTASNSDRHPTELAMLRGARLVTSSETEQGQHWAESKLKAITGGDLVVARFMRQDFFQYRPEFKLLIMGNHKPALRSVGPAMRRRFHLIPFTQHFDEERADPDLGEKLRTEWPGILQWAIEGCAKYLREGLVPPPVVLGATDEYLMSQDLVATWIDECCEQHYESQGLLKGLYGSFQCWCQAHGEPAASLRGLGAELEARGYRSKKVNRGKVILGLAVRSA